MKRFGSWEHLALLTFSNKPTPFKQVNVLHLNNIIHRMLPNHIIHNIHIIMVTTKWSARLHGNS